MRWDGINFCCRQSMAEHLMNLWSPAQTQTWVASMWSSSIYHRSGQIHITVSPLHRCPPFCSESHIFSFPQLFIFSAQRWVFVLNENVTQNYRDTVSGQHEDFFFIRRMLQLLLASSQFIYCVSDEHTYLTHAIICWTVTNELMNDTGN